MTQPWRRALPLLVLVLAGCQSLRDMRSSAWVATEPGTGPEALRHHISKDGDAYSGRLERIDRASGKVLAEAALQDCRYEAEIFTAWAELDGQRHALRLLYLDSNDDAQGSFVKARDSNGQELLFRQPAGNIAP